MNEEDVDYLGVVVCGGRHERRVPLVVGLMRIGPGGKQFFDHGTMAAGGREF